MLIKSAIILNFLGFIFHVFLPSSIRCCFPTAELSEAIIAIGQQRQSSNNVPTSLATSSSFLTTSIATTPLNAIPIPSTPLISTTTSSGMTTPSTTTTTTTTPTTTTTTTPTTTTTTTPTTTTTTTPTTTTTTTPTTTTTTTPTTTTTTTPTTTTTTTPTTTTTTTPTTTTTTTPTTTTTTTSTSTTTSTTTTTTSTTTTTTTTSCQQAQPANTAPLIFNPQQNGIADPTQPALVCPCSGAFTLNYLPRGNAAFDVQANAQCASLCVCDTNNVCYVPINVAKGNILIRFTTNCAVNPCVETAAVIGSGPMTSGCLAIQGTMTCAKNIGSTFNAIFVSCTGCPAMNVLTCGGAGTG